MPRPNPLHGLRITLIAVLTCAAGPLLSQSAGSEAATTTDSPIFIMPRSGPFAPETVAVPNARVIATWARSGHSDFNSESFSHWNEDGAIPPACSVCHSGIGFRAFHGLDGSGKGIPEQPVQIGGVVDCDTCHNPGISTITEVALPSGVVHPVSAVDAPCTTCHQGRRAGSDVAKATAELAEDEVNAELRYINPHYAVAAAINLGSYAAAGFHYSGQDYSGRFLHAKPVATCVSCHDPHSLEVAEATCLTCHDSGAPEEIRISRQSFDGSGQTDKGIHDDIAANSDVLMRMMTEYASRIAGTPMIYNGSRYPYFFADANGDAVVDEADGRPVAYASWTPRLLRATYNWKLIDGDAAAYVHNPHYALELLYDSISDLAGPLDVDMAKLGLLR